MQNTRHIIIKCATKFVSAARAKVGSKININWVTGYQLHWACHCAIYDASLAKQTHMRINIAKRVKVHMVTFNVGLPACFSIKYIEIIIKYIEIIIVS